MPTTISMAVALLGAILSHPPIEPESVLASVVDTADRSAVHEASPRSEEAASPGRKAPAARPAPGSKGNPLCGKLPTRLLRWDPGLGPLHLAGTVVVGPDQTLVLSAGTLVLVETDPTCVDSSGIQEGATLLVAGGSLIAEGKPDHPVVFQPAKEGKGFGWRGIRAEKAAEGAVDLAWIEVRRAQTGVSFVAGSGRLRNSVVENCGIGIASLSGAAPQITHSVVSRSLVADAVSERSAPLFRSCLFVGGDGDGLRFQGTGLARVEYNCFWGHLGNDIVRGPEGLGGWKGDSVPDRFGNWGRDPLLRDSPGDSEATARFRREMAARPWWKRRRMPDTPNGNGPWALSPLSPLLGAGERGLCGLPDGTRCDIGLWGGS